MLEFEWDQAKAGSNLEKHGVSFDEAASAFSDSLSLTIQDPGSSEGECRYIVLGRVRWVASLWCLILSVRAGYALSERDQLSLGSDEIMNEERSELRPEYDFSKGVRGKYSKRYAEGTNLVLLDVDVARAFTDAKAVNKALRTYLREHPAEIK